MTRKSAIVTALVAGAMMSSFGSANAEVRYVFTAFTSSNFASLGTLTEGNFTFLSPDFVVPNFTVPVADLTSCSAAFSSSGPVACSDQEFRTDLQPGFETIGFGVSGGGVTGHLNYDFGDTAFSSVGTFQSELQADQTGQLVVSIVPEPSTWAMMLLGFAGLGFAGYRVRRTAQIAATS
jgi:hypothetical protein